MPMVSKAQNRYFRGVVSGSIPGNRKVAREFIAKSHGEAVRKLPARIGKRSVVRRSGR